METKHALLVSFTRNICWLLLENKVLMYMEHFSWNQPGYPYRLGKQNELALQ